MAYERVLLELDRVHGDDCPALDTEDLTDDRDILLAVASNAIEELESYGIDPLSVELILAMLVDAQDLDINLMYGENGAQMRTELAALLRQHRVMHRLAADSPDERAAAGQQILRFRQTLVVWCSQAIDVA